MYLSLAVSLSIVHNMYMLQFNLPYPSLSLTPSFLFSTNPFHFSFLLTPSLCYNRFEKCLLIVAVIQNLIFALIISSSIFYFDSEAD